MSKIPQDRNDRLAHEIFELVEFDQGKGFICDGLGNQPKERIFAVVRGALKHTEAAARKMRRWLKKYGQD